MLRTYLLTGGQPFSLQRKNNPTLHHTGGMTVWKAALTAQDHAVVLLLIRGHGVACRVFDDGRQREEEDLKRGLFREWAKDIEFPTPVCPSCYFLDLEMESLCGLKDWPPERVEVGKKASAGVLSLQKCPLLEQKGGAGSGICP